MASTQRDRWIEYGASDEAIVAAVAEQRRFVMHKLGSRRWEADDVLAQVALDMVASMPRWVAVPQRPRPALGAWARGVAVRTFYAWVRGPGTGLGPGGAPMVSTDALAEQGVTVASPVEHDAGEDLVGVRRRSLIQALRRFVLAQPGGAAAWDAMVTPQGQVRGKVALARLNLLLEVADADGTLRRTAGLISSGAGDAGMTYAA